MKTIFIKEKLTELGIELSDVSLGEFDYIGEFSAKKMRDQSNELFNKVGAFFRPNYERGILIHSLIKKFNLQSFLEIGFGRGYSAICAAKALHEIGAQGNVVTIDPSVDENQLKTISATMPKEWLGRIQFMKGMSKDVLPTIQQKFDLVYVDGDHTAPAVREDWRQVKDKWNAFILFDDYHMPTKKETSIEVAQVIDEIEKEVGDDVSAELIIMDRRIFFDDRRISDEKIDYGQVLMSNKSFVPHKEKIKILNDW